MSRDCNQGNGQSERELKGCDIPITHAQTWCDISITTGFAISDVAKYHFRCSPVPQTAREVRMPIT